MRINDHRLAAHLPDTYPEAEHSFEIRPAAVLLLLLEHEGEDFILFTRRSLKLKKHRGQISFPGGKRDPEDLSLWQTALRETHEEIGVTADRITPLGALPAFPTHTGYYVYPYVGRMEWPVPLIPEPAEIDEIFRVPLAHLKNGEHHSVFFKEANGVNYPVHAYLYKHYRIWGITGAILFGFLKQLTPKENMLF